MNIILYFSNLMIPLVLVVIISYGFLRKVEVYDVFVDGAKDGLKTAVGILPTLIGLMVAVSILRASGLFEMISGLFAPLADRIGFPSETIPLLFMRLVSSSASTGMILDLFANFGPDSFTGRFVSVMMSCTETVFYTMSVYYMSIGIKKTGFTLPGALIANFVAVIASFYITRLVFT